MLYNSKAYKLYKSIYHSLAFDPSYSYIQLFIQVKKFLALQIISHVDYVDEDIVVNSQSDILGMPYPK